MNACKLLKQVAFFDGCQQECPKLEKKKGVCKYKGDGIWSSDRCLAETEGVASREIAALLSLPLRKMSKFQERLSNLLVVFLAGLV